MTFSFKSQVIFLSSLGLLYPLPVFSADVSCSHSGEQINRGKPPAHIISYKDDLAPEWKKHWDQARIFFAHNQHKKAVEQYRLLLDQKDTIDQARWEYVTVLMCLKMWQKAATELTLLKNSKADNPEYQLAEAEIALGLKDYETAAKIYANLHTLSKKKVDCTAENTRVLKGYVTALQGLSEYTKLLPLMEELVKLRPLDFSLHKSFAEVALQSNKPHKALSILENLAKKIPGDSQVFERMAGLHKITGNDEMAFTCWQQVIGIEPDNIEANRQLINYYGKVGNSSMQLKHVEHLLSMKPNNTALLLQAAQLCSILHRADRSLDYYNQILTLDPGNSDILSKKNGVTPDVVDQLLTLVNNSSTGMLWKDLVRSSVDKKEIYKSMVDILRVRGEKAQLVEVLLALQQEDPADMNIPKEINVLQKQLRRKRILAASDGKSFQEPVILSH